MGHSIEKKDFFSKVGGLFPDPRSVIFGDWFHYWNLPFHSWEASLASLGGSTVMIPINWSFHSVDGASVDFGEERPETNLVELASLCQNLEKEAIFLLPLTPLPLFFNGGVPDFLNRILPKNTLGISRLYGGSEGEVSRLYSLFDRRIFRAFEDYVKKLERHLAGAKGVSLCDGLSGGWFGEARRGFLFCGL